MNSTQIESFLTVADTLSFARAAELLSISQPAVTHQIKSLEAELGVTLFFRTTRRVTLTDEGRAFLPDAESIMHTMRRALDRFQGGLTAGPTPINYTIGCRSFAHTVFLADALRQMAQRFPNLHPDILVVPHDHLHQLLENSDVDVVLDFEGTGHKGEVFTPMTEVEVVCALPDGSPLAALDVIVQDDLDGQPLAVTRPAHIPNKIRESFSKLMSTRPPESCYFCDSTEAALTITAAGIALSVQPKLSLPPQSRLRFVPFKDVDPIVFGAYTFGSEKAELTQCLIELGSAALGSQP